MQIALRMALIALIIGTATSIAATGRITLLLLASGAICWSFVPVLQLLTGMILVRGASISRTDALVLYFETHRPWSLWLLSCSLLLLNVSAVGDWLLVILATFIIPMAFTIRQLRALCGRALGFDPLTARRRVALHQAVTVAVGLAYGEYAGGVFRRFIATITL